MFGFGLGLGLGYKQGGGSEFSPIDLSPALWLDASDTSTITESGGSVSQWDDKSGNDYHATQGTGSYQPATGTRTVNGLNVLDYDGSDDALNLPSALYSVTTGDATIFTVSVSDANSDSHILGGDSGKLTYQYKANHSFRFGLNNGSYNDWSITSMTSAATLSLQRNGTGASTVRARKDGVALGGLASSSDSTLTSLLVGRSPTWGQSVDGLIAEVLIFDKALTDAELNQVGNYLSAKWGITWTDI